MSTFDDNSYCWRETYQVMLDPKMRPLSNVLLASLEKLKNRHQIKNLVTGPHDFFASLTIVSPNDSAAIDILYREGDDVCTEFAALADELERHVTSPKERKKIQKARNFSAKIELLHFEQVGEPNVQKPSFPTKLSFPKYSSFIRNLNHEINDEPDEFDIAERLDPNTLIQILRLVTGMTEGIAFDPASGLVL